MSFTANCGGEPCAPFDEAAITCVPGLSLVASDGTDCGPIAASDIMPSHAFAVCSSPGEVITATGATTPDPITLTMTEIERGQFGGIVEHPATSFVPIGVGTLPATINVPAVNTDCVLGLHVTYGNGGDGGPDMDGLSIVTGTGTDVSAPTTAYNMPIGGALTGGGLFLFDPITGTTGSTVVMDFTTYGNVAQQGAVQYYWVEICNTATATSTLTVADFDLGNIVNNSLPGMPGSGTTGTSDPLDAGACDAVFFASARHVLDPDNSFDLNKDSDWFQITQGSEVYDTDSVSSPGTCQLGSASGTIPGGSGSFTWDYTNNGGFINGDSDAAFLHAIPVDCQGAAGGGEIVATESCSIDVTNPNCDQDGYVRCTMSGSVEVCLDDVTGSDITVVPVLNGVDYLAQAITLEAAIAAGAAGDVLCTATPVSFTVTDLANPIGPGVSANNTFTWKVIGGAGTVTISDWTSECEVIHV